MRGEVIPSDSVRKKKTTETKRGKNAVAFNRYFYIQYTNLSMTKLIDSNTICRL
jgi:hypothetical protein